MLVKKVNKTEAEVKMYGNIGDWFVDGFNFTTILDELEAGGVTLVTFRMHCYGGSVFEGNVIGNAFARSKMNIKIVIDGIAASMACMLLTYVPTENILIAENGFGMIHRPSGRTNGDAADHNQTAKLLTDMESNFTQTLATRTGLTVDEIKTRFFDGKDHWLNADEMVQLKLAGKKMKSIATITAIDKQHVKQMTTESIYGHYAAKLDILNNNVKNKTQMKEDLIVAFALEGVTAESSDTAVVNAVKAKFKANAERLAALETQAKAEKEAAVKAALDTALAAGKITAETMPAYKTIGESNGIEVLKTVLAGLQAKTAAKPIVIMDLLKNNGQNQQAPEKNWAWYQANNPKALEEMPVADPDTFKAIYKAEYGCDPEN